MADEQKPKTADSATKTPEQTKLQSNPLTAPLAPEELNHGEQTEEAKAEAEAAAKAARDPWGDTPLQMRDDHDPAVDPATNDPARGGADNGRSVRLDPMEPGTEVAEGEEPVKGGTNAPA